MIDLHDLKNLESFNGEVVFNCCHFIWVKFHGQIFIKIGTLELINYNYNDS
jgi:hypothetical protein